MKEQKIYEKQCKICGGAFMTTNSRRQYCILCKNNAQQYRNRIKAEKNKALKKEKPVKIEGLVNCTAAVMKKCVYGGTCGGSPCCNYILVEGHSRGCSPRQCDKYRTGKKATFKPMGQVVFK